MYQDCLLHMTSFLTFRDTLSLYLTSKTFNVILRPVHKKAVLIQKRFRHYLQGKKKRENLLYRYCTKLYNFKPFVIARIFDYSSLYRYKKNNRDFISKVIRNLTVLHNRSEEDEDDSTLLTQAQTHLFTYVLMYEKIIGVDMLKMLLRKLTIRQLAYVR
jgi:hypothetical protein